MKLHAFYMFLINIHKVEEFSKLKMNAIDLREGIEGEKKSTCCRI